MAKTPSAAANTALAPSVSSGLPSYIQADNRGSGLVGLDMEDFIIPRIKLLQGISPEVEQFEAAKSGQYWLATLDLPLGASFRFTPVSNRKRYLLSVPLGGTPKGILARADDGVNWSPPKGEWDVTLKNRRGTLKWRIEEPTVRGSGLAEFGTADPENPDSHPAATLFYDYLVLVHDVPEIEGAPVLLSMSRSQAKRARDLNAKIEMRRAPMQAAIFLAGVSKEPSPGGEGDYNNITFGNDGWVEEPFFKAALDLGKRYKNYRAADEEAEVAEAQGSGGAGGGSAEKDF